MEPVIVFNQNPLRHQYPQSQPYPHPDEYNQRIGWKILEITMAAIGEPYYSGKMLYLPAEAIDLMASANHRHPEWDLTVQDLVLVMTDDALQHAAVAGETDEILLYAFDPNTGRTACLSPRQSLDYVMPFVRMLGCRNKEDQQTLYRRVGIEPTR